MESATPKRFKSSVLAALDVKPNPENFEIFNPFPTQRKRKLTPGSPDPRNPKRVASGVRPNIPGLENILFSAVLQPPPGTAGLPKDHRQEFGIHYNEDAPISRLDLAAPDQQEQLATFVSKAIDNVAEKITVKEAMEHLGIKTKHHFLPGMEVQLLPHQIIGVSWLVRQERESGIKGGILADEMGLGKTVQMIALMTINQPEPDARNRTTLVVVPAALLTQWKEEIEEKTNDVFKVHIHHGKDKLKKLSAMRDKDIIITSYGTICSEFQLGREVKEEEEDGWLAKHGGLLARMEWYRVILDEAQFIRTRTTRASLTAAKLKTRYRWMLSGTPITNTLADIYPLLRFGRFRPFNAWEDFNTFIARVQYTDANLACARAQGVLKPLILRRMKDAELDGEPLLVLPKKHIEIETLEFSPEEREIYADFERQAKVKVNRFIREGSLLKNHAAVLVMILRLRQICSHPYLILTSDENAGDATGITGIGEDNELRRAITVKGYDWVNMMKQRFLSRARAQNFCGDEEAGYICPACQDQLTPINGRVLGCSHEICTDCVLQLRSAPITHDGQFGHGDEREREFETAASNGFRLCPTCKKAVDFNDKNVFKSSAFEPTPDAIKNADIAEERVKAQSRRATSSLALLTAADVDVMELTDDSDDELPDPEDLFQQSSSQKSNSCQKAIKRLESMRLEADGLEMTRTPSPSPASKNKGKEKAKDEGKKEELDPRLVEIWKRANASLEPSAKMVKLLALLKSWDATGDKTICFSQWTSVLDLIEMLFARNGIQNIRYDGKMDRGSREIAIATFKKPSGPKVMLLSTKCGSVGLNLTVANRCINLDLSWNYQSESQAYDRVHRIGQDKEVFVHRLVVRDTVEDRMLRLQETKMGLADAALGEGGSIKLHKLSVKELKALFGMSRNEDPNQGHLTF
ncbi:SNF2 family N-terminal domain-containing protein [Thelephora terrestris]|uniref:SNF2 family N-terminal domain-containing protein n=1 Tax=Thelephora terrestris TaxID=56493 RepID=A0A9P6HDJ8_9AGAM|nr:SNF2 family N-terminal domain-containing protein [Thelephora terrestris]